MKTWDHGDRQRLVAIEKALAEFPDKIEWLFGHDFSKPEMFGNKEKILEQIGVFSSGEQVLIKLALSIWFKSEICFVSDLVYTLDNTNFRNAIEAILLWRKI